MGRRGRASNNSQSDCASVRQIANGQSSRNATGMRDEQVIEHIGVGVGALSTQPPLELEPCHPQGGRMSPQNADLLDLVSFGSRSW